MTEDQDPTPLAELDEATEPNVVELSTHLDELPLWEPLPAKKQPDPAKQARRKRQKAARKKNRG